MSVVILYPKTTENVEIDKPDSIAGSTLDAFWVGNLGTSVHEESSGKTEPVTASQYTQFVILSSQMEKLLAEMSKQEVGRVARMFPHVFFATSGIAFLGMAAYFWSRGISDLGVASLGPAITALLASIFSLIARFGK